MVFGYAYPAYECYKTVEKNKPEIEQLRFWCQYWILLAVLSVCDRELGTAYLYDSFFRPFAAKHENEIDQNLLELRIRAGDMAVIYCQIAASHGQTRVFEILQYIASQSTPRPRPGQPQHNTRARQPPVTDRQQTTATQTEEPPSPTSSTSSSQHQKETAEAASPSQVPEAAPAKKIVDTPAMKQKLPGITSQSRPNEAEGMQIDTPANENSNPPPKETVMEETRVTHGRSRRNRSASNQ